MGGLLCLDGFPLAPAALRGSEKALPKGTPLQNQGLRHFLWMLMRDFGGKAKPQPPRSCSAAL